MRLDSCDKCGKRFEHSQGKVRIINDLDKCYICGNFEPVPVIDKLEQNNDDVPDDLVLDN